MKTSIRLALTSLLVCAITYAASGAPLPFLPKAQPTIAKLDASPSAGLELAAMSFSPN